MRTRTGELTERRVAWWGFVLPLTIAFFLAWTVATPAASTIDGFRADWIDLDESLLAAGAGRSWKIFGVDGKLVAEGTFAEPARRGVLARGTLYADQGDRVVSIVPGGLEPPVVVDLSVRREGTELLLGRILDYLVVVEQGEGVHLLTLPPPPKFRDAPMMRRHGHLWPERPTEAAFLPLASTAIDVAGFGTTVYLALTTGGVAVLDASDSTAPRFGAPLAIPGPVVAIAANGPRLSVLGGGSLRTYDLRDGAPTLVSRTDGIEGSAMEPSGRTVYLARGSDGVSTFRDDSTIAAIHFVTVSSFDFTPQNITVAAGDTVQWDNIAGTHDTDSCDVGQAGCPGAATEVFDSGAPAVAPWTFSHTFTLVGPNPYTCTLHGGLGMVGSVQVDPASSPAPPAVPDGDGASNPIRVTRLDSTGSALDIVFDDATCTDSADTQIVGGFGSDLPTVLGGTYGVGLSRCACGTTSPCNWDPSPQPAPGQLIWFVMTATDGSTTEGAWGADSAGNDRSGPGTNGSSGECGVTDRDLTNTCGS